MEIVEGFVWGVVGGLLAQLLELFKMPHLPPDVHPLWLKSLFYWCITTAMMLSGGVLVFVYLKSAISLNTLLAVNLGASAPLII